MKHSFTLVAFALDEEEALPDFLRRAEALLTEITDDFELIFTDDGSRDRTYDIAKEFAGTRPWMRIIRNDRTRGPAWSLKNVIPLATKQHLFWQTVDWSYDLTEIVRSLDWLDRVDLLHGVRPPALTARGLLTRSDNLYKGCVSLVNYFLVRLLFGLPLKDYQNITIYPSRLLQSFRLESESAFTGPEMLLKSWWSGATIKEVPVPFRPRLVGRSKGTRPRIIAVSIRDTLRFWVRWRLRPGRERRLSGTIVSSRGEQGM